MDLNLSIPSKLYSKSYFHAVHILADFKKKLNYAKTCTTRKCLHSQYFAARSEIFSNLC